MPADPSRTGAETNPDERPRTRTRLRGVAPAGEVAESGTPTRIGRYEVVDTIGRGAMGVVYKARDPSLERTVAIKTIVAPSSLARNVRKAFLERFNREAKAAARIAHPAIVTIFDVGVIEETDAPYLVMEYLPGETLADRLDRTRLPLGQGIQCARDLASALGCAHKERIVHRDVKPANVLHAGDQRWKLADFGIARMPDSDLTQIGIFMGTPGYAPPEAIREGSYTVQADVFAWGAVLYELLCGRVPYEGPDTATTNSYVLKAEPPSPRHYDASVPEVLAAVALRALAHDPKKRFANCNDAEVALGEAWDKSLAQGLVPVTAFASATGLPGRMSGPATPAPAAPIPAQASGPVKRPPIAPPSRDETEAPTTIFEPGQTPRPVPNPAVEKSDRLKVAAAVASAQASPVSPRQAAEARLMPAATPKATTHLWLLVAVTLAVAVAGAVGLFFLMKG